MRGEIEDVLVGLQGRGDGELGGHVRAQARTREEFEPVDVLLRVVLRSGEHHPSRAQTCGEVGLGQPVEGDGEQVRGEGRDADVLRVVVEDPVVDLVGQQQQVVLAGDLHDALQGLPRVHRAGGVVRIDDDDRAGLVRYLGAEIIQIRIPGGVLVAPVVDGRSTGERRRRGPQRVVGHGDENLVARAQQSGGHHEDQLGDPVTEEYIVGVELRKAGDLRVAAYHGLPDLGHSLGRGVCLCRPDVVDDALHGGVRCAEAEDLRIARIQLQDLHAPAFESFRLSADRTADLVCDVVQAAGVSDLPSWGAVGQVTGGRGRISHGHHRAIYDARTGELRKNSPGVLSYTADRR